MIEKGSNSTLMRNSRLFTGKIFHSHFFASPTKQNTIMINSNRHLDALINCCVGEMFKVHGEIVIFLGSSIIFRVNEY